MEDGKSEHRVCIFKDIVLWEGQLHYVAHGELFYALENSYTPYEL